MLDEAIELIDDMCAERDMYTKENDIRGVVVTSVKLALLIGLSLGAIWAVGKRGRDRGEVERIINETIEDVSSRLLATMETQE